MDGYTKKISITTPTAVAPPHTLKLLAPFVRSSESDIGKGVYACLCIVDPSEETHHHHSHRTENEKASAKEALR